MAGHADALRSKHEDWFGLWRRARSPRLRLIAIPYAGAGTAVYRRWLEDLAHEDWLDFAVVQLPGREKRLSEPKFEDIDILLETLEGALSSLSNLPYVLFGYSMGALLAYEAALRLTESGAAPRQLIVAARIPPYRVKSREVRLVLTREQLIAKILRLGSMSPSLIESDLFDNHILPNLQADFAMVDNHHRAVPQILPCPLLAMAGKDDPDVSVDQMRMWSVAGGRGFELEQYDGDHFFLHSAHERVIGTVNEVLGRYAPEQRPAGAAPLSEALS
jgi:medium-chain acyl-[acyl-carrier-protein] hydrolase